MIDLKVPVEDLVLAGRALSAVAAEFQNAKGIEEGYTDGIGHHRLAAKLHDVANNWKDHREHMLQEIDGLAKSASAAGQAYPEIERHLVAALHG